MGKLKRPGTANVDLLIIMDKRWMDDGWMMEGRWMDDGWMDSTTTCKSDNQGTRPFMSMYHDYANTSTTTCHPP
jgi:hypothetical protein